MEIQKNIAHSTGERLFFRKSLFCNPVNPVHPVQFFFLGSLPRFPINNQLYSFGKGKEKMGAEMEKN
jgi:hypothetical protein